jgi:S-adenosylmethionine:tRNA ribosyltransferase-isomerase
MEGIDPAQLRPREGRTELMITPGHEFCAIDGLITNFHLPRSSLIALVAAFAGLDSVLNAYQIAIDTGYRFYSYGDAMLII